jgi:hypothetical protein
MERLNMDILTEKAISAHLDDDDIEDIIMVWYADNLTTDRMMYKLGKSALNLAMRGDNDNALKVWSFASRLNSLGKKRLYQAISTHRLASEALDRTKKKRGGK